MSIFQRKVIRAINALFPKNSHKVMMASNPDFSDNARALFDYMINQKEFEEWEFVWVVKQGFCKPKESKARFILNSDSAFSKDGLIYYYHLFTSKYLFCTHSHFVAANPKKQVSVCLWHGTMLKRICAMNEREKNQPRKDQYRYFVSSSKFYVDFFCKSFLCKSEQVLISGYPRNDFLFQDTNILSGLGIDKACFDKIVVYMPTFRTPVGRSYTDSDARVQTCFNLDDKSSMLALSNRLKNQNMLLVVKWHPADTRQGLSINMPNIMFVNNYFFATCGLQVYHLLHYADALITDYSSVFCDYMLLDRPIAFDIADMESYADNRGFVFDKPLDYMPGYIIKNGHDLNVFIDDIANGVDKSANKRHELYSVYNDFCDDQASARIVNLTIQDLSVGI